MAGRWHGRYSQYSINIILHYSLRQPMFILWCLHPSSLSWKATSNDDDSEDIYADPEFDKFLENADISQLESDPVTAAVQSIPSISNAALTTIPWISTNTLSHVLEDIWHVKDHFLRLLPESYLAFKKFRLAFGKAIFVFDKNDQAQWRLTNTHNSIVAIIHHW